MKVQSAIQARIHASLKKEYKILARIIRDFTEPDYPYETDEGEGIKVEDFDDRIDVVPVSDPNASTMAQRIMQYQAALQLAAQAPNMYDLPLLHRQMMELIGIPNAEEVVPSEDDTMAKDPVSENQNILTMSPVKAYEYQDHEAHMRVHMVLKNDPEMAQEVQNSPAGGAVMGALDAHVREHLAFIFRRQVEEELGVQLPPSSQPLPQDIEERLSSAIADAADQMMGKKQAQAKAEENAKLQEDPIIQQKERELKIREMDAQRRSQTDQGRLQIEQQKLAAKQQVDAARQQADAMEFAAKQQMDAMDLQLEEQKLLSDAQIEREKMASKEKIEQAELEQEREEMMLEAEIEMGKFEGTQRLEGMKFGRDMAKDLDADE
jgi:hypothetical protein